MPRSHEGRVAVASGRSYAVEMDRDTAISILRSHAGELRQRGVTALYLFGSTAADDAAPSGDVDLFIDYDEHSRFSLVELAGLKEYLEQVLNTEADVLTRDSLHPLLKEKIVNGSIKIFDETT